MKYRRSHTGSAPGLYPFSDPAFQGDGSAPCPDTRLDPSLAGCYPYGGNPQCRTRFLGLRVLAVAAGAIAQANVTPQTPFVVHRIVIPSSIAPFFTFDEMVIGNASQFVGGTGAGTFSAEVFTEVAVDVIVRTDPIDNGTQIRIQATNIDTDPHDFFIAFIGTSVGHSL